MYVSDNVSLFQVQRDGGKLNYMGTVDALKSIWKNEGVTGVYKGPTERSSYNSWGGSYSNSVTVYEFEYNVAMTCSHYI